MTNPTSLDAAARETRPAATDYACPECHGDTVLADRRDAVGICSRCGWFGPVGDAAPTGETPEPRPPKPHVSWTPDPRFDPTALRRADVLALEATCERCGQAITNPTTGIIAGDCAYCGGRMVATRGAWSMSGASVPPASAPAATPETIRCANCGQPCDDAHLDEWGAWATDAGLIRVHKWCAEEYAKRSRPVSQSAAPSGEEARDELAERAEAALNGQILFMPDPAVILALLAAVERGAEDTRDAEPTIREMQAINAARSARWMAGSPGWTTLEIAGELAGEVGELANVCKKLRRSEMGVPGNKVSDDELRRQARSEMADVFIVLMLTASKLGVDLYEAVCDTFNAKSEQMGFPERFPARAALAPRQTTSTPNSTEPTND